MHSVPKIRRLRKLFLLFSCTQYYIRQLWLVNEQPWTPISASNKQYLCCASQLWIIVMRRSTEIANIFTFSLLRYSMFMEPGRRSNFFSPPAHLYAVTYMIEISLIVMLNNHFTNLLQSACTSSMCRHIYITEISLHETFNNQSQSITLIVKKYSLEELNLVPCICILINRDGCYFGQLC